MLVFVDESGDTGLKLDQGSSRYFTVVLVAFNEDDEAIACDRRIELLKKEIGWSTDSEFHFKRNSDTVREAFLHAVSPYNFFYYGIVIDKDPRKLYGDGFKNKASFYKYVSGLVFENAKGRLENATVVVDQSSSEDFQQQLRSYIKRKVNTSGRATVKKLKMQRSQSNNLLQLADYIASIVNRSVLNKKKYADEFRRIVAHREMQVQIWPK